MENSTKEGSFNIFQAFRMIQTLIVEYCDKPDRNSFQLTSLWLYNWADVLKEIICQHVASIADN